MDENRLKHSFAVANKMVELDNGNNKEEVFLIGYKFTEDKNKHNKIGGEIIKDVGFKHWQEIYYHGEVNCKYNSYYLDLLNKCDMMIDSYGNDVGFDNRLEDIKNRYGENSRGIYKRKRIS